ncbi:MAG: hypothetical protein KAH04_06790, partial [Psychrilyobacter sp.]|nr:hypothetical protein [Psychrilyobacter sp.]
MDKKQIKRGRKIVLVVIILLSIGIYSLTTTNSKDPVVVQEKTSKANEKKTDKNLEKKEKNKEEVKEVKE